MNPGTSLPRSATIYGIFLRTKYPITPLGQQVVGDVFLDPLQNVAQSPVDFSKTVIMPQVGNDGMVGIDPVGVDLAKNGLLEQIDVFDPDCNWLLLSCHAQSGYAC